MVFELEGTFSQFVHCQYKENVVASVLHIPLLLAEDGGVKEALLVVSKWGSVALYHPHTMGLLHTFSLQLSDHPTPRCQRSHLVVDAVYANDISSIIFATNKCILMCFDIGELDLQNLGLEILPRRKFMWLSKDRCPVTVVNRGMVETHRILGLDSIPSCMTYYPSTTTATSEDVKDPLINAKLFVGDMEGGVNIVEISSKITPFLGRRKLRGTLAILKFQDLRARGKTKFYRAHNEPVLEIKFLEERNLIISASRDKKFSLFCQDYSESFDSFIISLPKGVNSVTYSNSLNIIVTGSEDGIVRIFSQFSMKMPQMELCGHNAGVVGVNILSVPFSQTQIILSYSKDLELRAWDPVSFACLQHLYLRIPPAPLSSTIFCKTAQFSRHSLILHQPHFSTQRKKLEKEYLGEGFILLMFCNSYVKLELDVEDTYWPFNYEQDFFIPSHIGNGKASTKTWKIFHPKNPKSLRLSAEEEKIVEKGSHTKTESLLRLKHRIQCGREGTKPTHTPQSLALSATKTFSSLDKGTRILAKDASIFHKLPLYDLQSIHVPSQPKPYLS